MDIESFKKTIFEYYQKNKRDLPWRNTNDPYRIYLSEVMLQQTQVPRVLIKYEQFLQELPTFESLAKAPFEQVLRLWSGLGYNRRAIYLHTAAKEIVSKYHGVVPQYELQLETFPGIGKATARSIVVFTYNKPLVFIETNIRRVFLYHFFPKSQSVSDEQLVPFIQKSLDTSNPRDWYYALMDYGSFLRKTIINPNRKSKHYTKQPRFEGSIRQVRGEILRKLLQKRTIQRKELEKLYKNDSERFEKALQQLEQEGFITGDNILTLKR